MRKYARQDANAKELTAAFKRMGCSVADLSPLGGGIADALIGYAGLCILCEYKDASKPPSARRLTPDQEKFRMNWTGGYRVVKDLDDVLATVNVMKGWQKAIHESLRPAPPVTNGKAEFHTCGLADCPFCLYLMEGRN